MDATTDSTRILESIRDTFADLSVQLSERLTLEERDLPPAVDTQWVQRHARLAIPRHTLSPKLQRLGLDAHVRRQMVRAFEDGIRALHTNTASLLLRACNDMRTFSDTCSAPVHREMVEKLIISTQRTFERRIQRKEDDWVALCAEQHHQPSPHRRGKAPRTPSDDSDLALVKEEELSDEELPGVEADPKQYHNMLEYIFRSGIEKPSRSDKMAFAARTGLSYRTITVWFQNRRSRGVLGGRCGWREKQRMRSLGMTDEQILMIDDLNGLEPISSSSAEEEPLESESDVMGSVTEVGELRHGSAPGVDVASDLSETEAEFNESEWETDLEDAPDNSTPFHGIQRVPSLTRSVSTSSSASARFHHSASNSDADVESRAPSLEPEIPLRSPSPVSIPPPAFNYRAARQLRSPSPAPSLHSKSPLLNDDAKLPPLDTPQLNAPFRLGSWRTNHSSGSLSQTLVTMRVPQVQPPTPSLSPSPALDCEDQMLDAPSPAESEDGPKTPPAVTGFAFTSSDPSQPIDTQSQTPRQFVFGSLQGSRSGSPSQFTFSSARNPSSSPNVPAASFTFNPQQSPLASLTHKELSAPFVFGPQQSSTPSAAPPQSTVGPSPSPSPIAPSPSATTFRFGTVHGVPAGSSPSKFNFSVPLSQFSSSRTSNVRSSSGGTEKYCTPYTGGRQPSPTIAAVQFSIPSPGAFDFSNPRPPSPENDRSAKNVAVPAVFTFGMQPLSASTQQAAQPMRPPNEKLDAARQKAVTAPFTFGNVDKSPTPFVFGNPTPKNTSSAELAPNYSVYPASSQTRRLSAASKSPVVHPVSSPPSTSSSVTIPPPPTRHLEEQVASSSNAQANIPQRIASLVAKGKATLVSTPRKPSTLPKHVAAARSLSRVASSRHVSSSASNHKGKGKMPVRDLFETTSMSRSTDKVTQLDILADAALGRTTLDQDTELEAAYVPLPASPPPRGAPLPLLNEYDDSDADSDADDADDEDEPLMGNALPPIQATTSPPSSAFNFSFPAPASLSAPRPLTPVFTEDIRKRLILFTQNYRTSGVPQRPAVALADRG